jgi:hypothetical protein
MFVPGKYRMTEEDIIIFQKRGKKYTKKLEILAQVGYHKNWLLALR